jgi:hypothetical protein
MMSRRHDAHELSSTHTAHAPLGHAARPAHALLRRQRAHLLRPYEGPDRLHGPSSPRPGPRAMEAAISCRAQVIEQVIAQARGPARRSPRTRLDAAGQRLADQGAAGGATTPPGTRRGWDGRSRAMGSSESPSPLTGGAAALGEGTRHAQVHRNSSRSAPGEPGIRTGRAACRAALQRGGRPCPRPWAMGEASCRRYTASGSVNKPSHDALEPCAEPRLYVRPCQLTP